MKSRASIPLWSSASELSPLILSLPIEILSFSRQDLFLTLHIFLHQNTTFHSFSHQPNLPFYIKSFLHDHFFPRQQATCLSNHNRNRLCHKQTRSVVRGLYCSMARTSHSGKADQEDWRLTSARHWSNKTEISHHQETSLSLATKPPFPHRRSGCWRFLKRLTLPFLLLAGTRGHEHNTCIRACTHFTWESWAAEY